jgi:hypothetical protein
MEHKLLKNVTTKMCVDRCVQVKRKKAQLQGRNCGVRGEVLLASLAAKCKRGRNEYLNYKNLILRAEKKALNN